MAISIQPVILSGGSGTRLWPLSRGAYPKPLLRPLGPRSLLQETALRLEGLDGDPRAPMVVCNEEHRFETAEQLRDAGRAASTIILEPAGRNTAPALSAAALELAGGGEDPVMLVLPADHLIQDAAALRRSISAAARHAAAGDFVVFGVRPDRPETAYGYLRAGPALGDSAHRLEAFVEKPDAARAAEYLRSGAYAWNSGMFMLRASCWSRLIARFRPDIAAACASAWSASQRDGAFLRLHAASFLACPAESIDRAVAEPLTAKGGDVRPVVVPLDAGWSDVGSWDAVRAVGDQDERGNVSRGGALLVDTDDTLVIAEGRLVAALGTRQLVIVETADAVMVSTSDRAQDVKELVSRLKSSKRGEADAHRKVYRPWGHFDLLHAGPGFLVKSLVVKPGGALSLQRHRRHAEPWVAVRGTAKVPRGAEQLVLHANQATYIPLGIMHRP